jgi:excinuclease ABC subunit B
VMYADNMTDSMRIAIDETNRRRKIQNDFNEENGIVPRTIIKEIRLPIHNTESEIDKMIKLTKHGSRTEINKRIKELEKQMKQAAQEFDFERAAELRDIILEMKTNIQ